MEEEKLHRAILEALNEFAQAGSEVKADMLDFTRLVWAGQETDGTSLLSLKQRLNDITAEQALLLNQVLANMDDEILTAQLKALMDGKTSYPRTDHVRGAEPDPQCGPGIPHGGAAGMDDPPGSQHRIP